MHRLFIPAFCILQLVSAQAQCFFPNAIAINASNLGGSGVHEYVPCNTAGTTESMCCRTNTTDAPDTCRPDGLCESFGGGGVWRDSCTDALWRSEYCVALCLNGTDDRGDQWGETNAPVTVCDDGSYCCGNNFSTMRDNLSGPDCCAAHQGVFLENGGPTSTKPNANASTSSTASVAAGTSDPSSTPAKEINTRIIVIGVLGGLAGSALVVLGIRLVMIKRNMRADLAARDSAALKQPGMISYVNLGWGPCEAPTYAGEYTREELHGEDVERPQLDGNQRLEKG